MGRNRCGYCGRFCTAGGVCRVCGEPDPCGADCSICDAPGGYCVHSGDGPSYDGPAYDSDAEEFVSPADIDDFPSREVSVKELRRRIAAKAEVDDYDEAA